MRGNFAFEEMKLLRIFLHSLQRFLLYGG